MVMTSSAEAKPAKRQHKKPCHDCPWRRTAMPGWLGGDTPAAWVAEAHSDNVIECHTRLGVQCAGAAIYRANVCKTSRDTSVLRLPSAHAVVFSSPTEFMLHHARTKKE